MTYKVYENGVEREATADEIIEIEARSLLVEKELDEQSTKAAARQAVLDKLGLTADEAAALLG